MAFWIEDSFKAYFFNVEAPEKQDFVWGGVKTERVFPGLSVLRKNNKMEVLYPEK